LLKPGIPLCSCKTSAPRLVTKTTLVNRPKFPVIDAHNHLGEPFGGGWDAKPLSELLDLLDEAGVRMYVDLDGGWGEDILAAHLDPLWQAAGELGLPVLAHVADPVAFFDPIDETNERWEELGQHPDWAFTSPPFPSFLSILEAFKNLVTRHSSTIFIGAHVGCYGEWYKNY
jgi:hypothetical protein